MTPEPLERKVLRDQGEPPFWALGRKENPWIGSEVKHLRFPERWEKALVGEGARRPRAQGGSLGRWLCCVTSGELQPPLGFFLHQEELNNIRANPR